MMWQLTAFKFKRKFVIEIFAIFMKEINNKNN